MGSGKSRGIGDWGSCPEHQGRGYQRGESKVNWKLSSDSPSLIEAQYGNLAQGTRNHRFATANGKGQLLRLSGKLKSVGSHCSVTALYEAKKDP